MIQETAPHRQEDQFRELFGVLRRRKTIVALTTLLFLVLGVVSVALSPASYQVVARAIMRSASGAGENRSNDPIELMTKAGMSPDVATQIGLMGGPDVQRAAFSTAQVTPSGELSEPPVTITPEVGGPMVDVVVNWPNGDEAARIAQAIPAAYNDAMKADAKAKNDEGLRLANERLTAARATLHKAEVALEAELSRQGPGGELVTQGGNEGAERSARLSGYQQQLDSEKIGLESQRTQLRESIAARDALPETIRDTRVAASPELAQGQRQRIYELESALKAMLVVQTEGSPDVKTLRTQIKAAQEFLRSLPKTTVVTPVVRNPDRLGYDSKISEEKIGIGTTQMRIASLEAKVAKERAGLADYEKRIPHQNELRNAVDSARVNVASAAQTVANLETLGKTSLQPLQVLSVSAPAKTQPVVARTIISSTLIGFVLGVVFALLRDRFDNRVYTLEQIYDVSGAVPIGAVSTSAKALGPNVGGQSRNRVLESYRSLRFNLESSADGNAAQSVLVASASAGEGRAGLSLNLATEAATDQRKTILVDADMRTPELHDILKLSRGPGLSEVLSGSVGLDEALQPTSQANMMFLSAGGEHGLPLELLTGPSFVALHEALKERADVIVLNSPSLMRYTDGRAIARIADSVLFVAKRGFTRRDAMRYCIGMLRRTKARLLGVVLSDDSGRSSDVPYYATE